MTAWAFYVVLPRLLIITKYYISGFVAIKRIGASAIELMVDKLIIQ